MSQAVIRTRDLAKCIHQVNITLSGKNRIPSGSHLNYHVTENTIRGSSAGLSRVNGAERCNAGLSITRYFQNGLTRSVLERADNLYT